jgi:hypothetical protein
VKGRADGACLSIISLSQSGLLTGSISARRLALDGRAPEQSPESAPGTIESLRFAHASHPASTGASPMSGHGFHVHGPHDHEVEHVAQHGGDSFTSRVAVLTAVISTVGAIFGYMGGHSQNAALLYKNEAAIQKTAASNQWNYYQAKSNKQNLAELSVTLTSGDAQKSFVQAVERYKQEKEEIKVAAEALEDKAKAADGKSNLEMHVHERWALATTLMQVAIALSAITLLTRKRWMLAGVYGATAIGVAFGVMGYLHL